MKSLSPKQKRILDFIRRFVEDRGYPPSIRDIVRGCDISSTSVADYNLNILKRDGFIRRDPEVSRGIELLQKDKRLQRLVRVPLIGTIAAGQPIPVPDSNTWDIDRSQSIEVSRDLIRNSDKVYALKVKGTSMIDALINDGDIVLMEQAATADDGDMVAAWLKSDGEATLKKVYHERNRIRLQPANSALKPIYADPDSVEVQGKVIGVIRQL